MVSPAILQSFIPIEALERRQLLAVNFAAADLAGTWSIFADGSRGSIIIDSTGRVTGGSFIDDTGRGGARQRFALRWQEQR